MLVFERYLRRLKENPRFEQSSVYDLDYTDLLFTLHKLACVYAKRLGLKNEEIPIPDDITFRRTKSKVSLRCGFRGAIDAVGLNNAVVDLGLEKTITMPDGEGNNVLIEINRYYSQIPQISFNIPEF